MTELNSFGRVFAGASDPISLPQALSLIRSRGAKASGLLAYGNGRSYGDSCLNASGQLINMGAHAGLIYFDEGAGILAAEAGMSLAQAITLARSRGYFPAVVPGTQFVTLGGAVANDIHGKNHHSAGTFGNNVEWLDLLRSDGVTYRCSRTRNAKLFSATIGGMGLTGLILSVAIRLKRAPSPDIIENRHAFRTLAEYLELAEAVDADNEYAVAWINQLATGKDTGQGVLLAGNHASHPTDKSKGGGGAALLGVPFSLPMTVLNKPFIKAFNAAYGWAKSKPANDEPVGWRSYFFPLDGVRDWNRLYGPRGLYQHQSVVPFEAAQEMLPKLLAATHKAGQGSFLTVLKRFGAIKSPGLLSFPRPGYTLTLDFPNHGEKTLKLLSELDAITMDAGGAVNPYKDARMSPRVFEASFANWSELEAARDPAFMSDFWRRTAMTLGQAGMQFAHAAE